MSVSRHAVWPPGQSFSRPDPSPCFHSPQAGLCMLLLHPLFSDCDPLFHRAFPAPSCFALWEFPCSVPSCSSCLDQLLRQLQVTIGSSAFGSDRWLSSVVLTCSLPLPKAAWSLTAGPSGRGDWLRLSSHIGLSFSQPGLAQKQLSAGRLTRPGFAPSSSHHQFQEEKLAS